MMQHILLVYNAGKAEAVRQAQETARYLRTQGYEVVLADQQTVARWEQLPDPHIALVVTLGGDGTLLTGAHLAAPAGVPILGVHLGRFGFIAQVEPEALRDALERWRQGNYVVQERLMVQARVAGEIRLAWALNEIALLRHPTAPMLDLAITINGLPLTTYPADGSLVATPTGSTAYAFPALYTSKICCIITHLYYTLLAPRIEGVRKIAPAAWFGGGFSRARVLSRARRPCPYRYGCGSRTPILRFPHPDFRTPSPRREENRNVQRVGYNGNL